MNGQRRHCRGHSETQDLDLLRDHVRGGCRWGEVKERAVLKTQDLHFRLPGQGGERHYRQKGPSFLLQRDSQQGACCPQVGGNWFLRGRAQILDIAIVCGAPKSPDI